MAAVAMQTMSGMAFFAVTGGGTPESPYVPTLTTSSATSSVCLKTSAGSAFFGVTGGGTAESPYHLCVSSS